MKQVVVNNVMYLVFREHDISSNKAYEKELKYSNERLEQLAFQSNTFAWEVDTNGIYTYVSPIVENVLGFRPEELVSKKHFWELIENDTDVFKNSVSIIGK